MTTFNSGDTVRIKSMPTWFQFKVLEQPVGDALARIERLGPSRREFLRFPEELELVKPKRPTGQDWVGKTIAIQGRAHELAVFDVFDHDGVEFLVGFVPCLAESNFSSPCVVAASTVQVIS